MKKGTALWGAFLIFAASVLFRLPNLDRPVSKHHEFNTAMVLINIISWNQAGGGEKFHFVPLLNFQHSGDQSQIHDSHTDEFGNTVYISLGPGFFMMPYFLYRLLHLPVVPVYLQLLNLIFQLAAILALFRLLENVFQEYNTRKYPMILFACVFFAFSPGMLWYSGNGYTSDVIMLPFVIVAFSLLIKMISQPDKIDTRRLVLLALSIFGILLFDWFGLFFCLIAFVFVWLKRKRHKKYSNLLALIGIMPVFALLTIFALYGSYLGPQKLLAIWEERLKHRSAFGEGSISLVGMIKLILFNTITALLPLILSIFTGWIVLRTKKIEIRFSYPEKVFVLISALVPVLYNAVLIEWSAQHEYSVIPWTIFLAFLAAKCSSSFFSKTRVIIPVLFIGVSLAQYFYINRPGNNSRDGMRYDSFRNFGLRLKHVDPEYTIFTSLPLYFPMIAYYAQRNYTSAANPAEAKKWMQLNKISKAVWVDGDLTEFRAIHVIK